MVRLRYLLDTNALLEPIRNVPDPSFMKKFRLHEMHVAIAAITWNEAFYGLHRLPQGRRKDLIAEYLIDVVAKSIPVLPYDAAAAEWHATERARLQAKGRMPTFADGQMRLWPGSTTCKSSRRIPWTLNTSTASSCRNGGGREAFTR